MEVNPKIVSVESGGVVVPVSETETEPLDIENIKREQEAQSDDDDSDVANSNDGNEDDLAEETTSSSSSDDENDGHNESIRSPAIAPKHFSELQEPPSEDSSDDDNDYQDQNDEESVLIRTVTSLANDLVSRIVEGDHEGEEDGMDNLEGSFNDPEPQRRRRGRPQAVRSPQVEVCAHCNSPCDPSSEKGESKIYFKESLPVLITIREEDDGRGERKREVIVYDALVDIFQLRWKPAQSKLLNVAMASEKDLFVCHTCATRLAHLYEEYNEFTQLAIRTGSFLSPILVGRAGIKAELYEDDGMDMDALVGQNVAAVYDNDFEENDGFNSYEDVYRDGPMSVQLIHEIGFKKQRGRRGRPRGEFSTSTQPLPNFDEEETPKKRRRNSMKLQCPTCSKEYLNQASYEKHLRLHRRKMRIVNPNEPKRRVGRPRKVVAEDVKPNYREIDEDDPFPDPQDQKVSIDDENGFAPPWGKRRVSCTDCGKKFMSHGHLLQHMKTHNKRRNFCQECNKTFRYPSELEEHMEIHKNNALREPGFQDDEDIAGPSALDDFSDGGEPAQHSEDENSEAEEQDHDQEDADSIPSEQDSDSDEYEPSRRQTRKRRRGRPRTKSDSGSRPSTSKVAKKPTEPVTCPECQREFRHPSFLQQHMQVHNKKFMCNQCNQEFQDAKGLREHKAEHRREKRANIEPMPCKYCGRQYYDDIRLFRHEETHELPPPIHKCNQCTRSFRRKDTLISHLATAHTTDCPFECPSCEKKYPRKDKLNRHIARKHGEVKGCDQCGKSFIGEAALKAHQITHFFEKPRELVCHVCGRKYQNLKYLKNHIKFMHTKRNAHACTLCTKTFGRYSCLQKHLIVHQEVGSFLCVHCGKCFKRERSLKQHEQKAHLGESSYENICPICSKRFHRIDLLKAHQVKEGHLEPVPPPEPAPVVPPPPPYSTGSPEPRFGMYDPGNRGGHHHNHHGQAHSQSHSTQSSNDSFPHAHALVHGHGHSHGHGHGHPIGNMHPAHVHHPSVGGDQHMNPGGLPASLAPDFLFAGLNMNMSGMHYSYDRH